VFEDLIVAVDGEPVVHPQVVLDAIRSARKGQVLRLQVARRGERLEVDAPITHRKREWKKAYIPLIYRYENDGQERTLSFLLGIFKCTATDAASRVRILWIFSFQRGDADRLDEVDT
jgi:C-terminal processing protease CtpA/Prc